MINIIYLRSGEKDKNKKRVIEEWQAGVASRCGKQVWQAGVASRCGKQVWQAGVASRYDKQVW